MSFDNLRLIDPIRKAVQTQGYTTPTPIQQQAIPLVLEGRDLLGCAQTGTGKTAAFAIPVLQNLHSRPSATNGKRAIRALVLTPTRELAIQVADSFGAYGQNTGLRHTVIFGGVSQHAQTSALRNGVDILVATPGRLLDLMQQGYVHLDKIEVFILDEADRMLDMGFIHDIKKILPKLPKQRQSLFFSATMPNEIMKLSSSILTNPVRVEVTPVSSTAETISQSIYFTNKKQKGSLLVHLLNETNASSVLVFARTKHGADRVVRDLKRAGVSSDAIHGNKSQNARQKALGNFKNGSCRVLVATDIAARGIDIDELGLVINFDLPNIAETYVHRIGRTGRAGNNGHAISFCDHEEKAYLKDIQKLTGINIPVNNDHPYPISDTHVPAQKPASGSQGQRNNYGNGNRNNSRNGNHYRGRRGSN